MSCDDADGEPVVWLRVKQAAERSGFSRATIQAAFDAVDLPGVRLIAGVKHERRLLQGDVDVWAADRRWKLGRRPSPTSRAHESHVTENLKLRAVVEDLIDRLESRALLAVEAAQGHHRDVQALVRAYKTLDDTQSSWSVDSLVETLSEEPRAPS